MTTVPLKIKLLSPTAIAPTRQHPTDSGLDLHLDLGAVGDEDYVTVIDNDVTLDPYERFLAPTGIALGIPEGYEVQIRSRSGLAVKHGVRAADRLYGANEPVQVLNHPGTVDQGYTGEIKVVLINLGEKPIVLYHGDRIAQMVLCPVCLDLPEIELFQVDDLDQTVRGACGFGSTGLGEK